MSYKDKYLRRNQNYSPTSLRDSYIETSKDIINKTFLDNPAAKEVYFNDSDMGTWVWIVEDTKVPTIKKIVMSPDEQIESGWTIKWNGQQWLVVSVDKSKDIYETGFIEKCNSTLKWIDSNGNIQSHPSIFYYGTKANFGTFSDKVMTLPDGRRQIVVQKNEHTVKIKRNMRFMFGGNVFIVIDHDHVSEEGIVNINLKDDQFNPATDNMELGIADYYGRVNDAPDEDENDDDDTTPSGYSIVIKSTSDKPNEIKRNQTKEYYVEIKNGENLVSGEIVEWYLFGEDKTSNTNLATFNSQASTGCVIKNNNATSGIVWLKVILLSDDTAEGWIRIEMKNLF